MGRKVHPYGFRVGVTRDWESKWFAEAKYADNVHEDIKLRNVILNALPDAGVSQILIDRNATQITLTVMTAKPGIVIGRGGQNAEMLRGLLQGASDARVRLNIEEIRVPEMDAFLVARSVADQLERRVAFRRAMKQGVQRTMQRGAVGCKVKIGGRLGGTEMSRSEYELQGRVPLHTLRADIDYGQAVAHTTYGSIGVKCWIYKGDIAADETPFARAGLAESDYLRMGAGRRLGEPLAHDGIIGAHEDGAYGGIGGAGAQGAAGQRQGALHRVAGHSVNIIADAGARNLDA